MMKHFLISKWLKSQVSSAKAIKKWDSEYILSLVSMAIHASNNLHAMLY